MEQSIAPDERSFSPPQTSDISSGGTSPPHHLQPPQGMQMSASMAGMASPIDDEIIPTAIVIKNIPFTVKRETLLDIIVSRVPSGLCRTNLFAGVLVDPYAVRVQLPS